MLRQFVPQPLPLPFYSALAGSVRARAYDLAQSTYLSATHLKETAR